MKSKQQKYEIKYTSTGKFVLKLFIQDSLLR